MNHTPKIIEDAVEMIYNIIFAKFDSDAKVTSAIRAVVTQIHTQAKEEERERITKAIIPTIEEAIDLFDDASVGEYKPDSFTSQSLTEILHFLSNNKK